MASQSGNQKHPAEKRTSSAPPHMYHDLNASDEVLPMIESGNLPTAESRYLALVTPREMKARFSQSGCDCATGLD
jgi:hypothetical protein